MEQSRDLTCLKDVFPQTDEPRPIRYPLQEFILLTHPVLGTCKMKDPPVFSKSLGTPGNGTNATVAVPAGKLWIIPFCHAGHDDAAARQVRLSLYGPDAASIITLNSSPGAIASGIKVSSARTLYLPQGCKLVSEVDAIAGGAHAELGYFYWEVPIGELLDIP